MQSLDGDIVPHTDRSTREQMLEMLLAELDGMVYRCRVDEHWTMEFVSEGCLALTGYAPRDLLLNRRISYEELTHPEDRARVREELHRAIDAAQPFHLEYRIVAKGGEVKWVWERGTGLPRVPGRPPMAHGFIQDITRRHLHEQALAEAEQRYRSIFENATEGIFQTSEDGHYLEVNPALAAIYGYDSPRDLIGALVDIGQQLYVEPARRWEFARLMREEGKVCNFESRVYRRDGSIIWISENAHAVHGPDGRLLYYEGTVEDISERKSYEARISHQATHDSLTNLPNRLLLTERIAQTIRAAAAANGRFAVLFIDLDHFKNVNDTLGHAGGDVLITMVAERLRGCLRDGDTVARLGGDEFVLLLPDVRPDELSRTAARLLAVVQEPCYLENREFPVSCSMGISVYPDDGREAEILLRHADTAMYQAKENGGNSFRFFSREFNRRVIENLELEHRLRQAIVAHQFELHYQPIFHAGSGALARAEALLRWRVPGEGLVMPERFIPVAEHSGLIEPLGALVLDQAGRQLRAWTDAGLAEVPVSVNISPRQFRQVGLAAALAATLKEYNLGPERLEIEITESCMARDRQHFLRTLGEIKALGVSIAIDDFGSGYSNMDCLKTLRFDALKIDRSFITGVDNDDRHRAIYRAIVSMAHHLGLRAVAEGVETARQFEFLRAIGCDEIQGFHLGRPLPADEFAALLAT